MPGKIKVKVLAGRNLPVMDRASDTTDAFVEIKFGSITHKTDVCRKSLNPHWSSTEWYRFEVDDSELQDEPLQLRLMDHDTYSANDAIGKVVISLAPLLAREATNIKNPGASPGGTGAVMSGWVPVFDTMHGIRGELNIIVKVELFSDFNKYKTSSCGVQFFHCPMIPPGYRITAIHGFVEELVVNDDPEYQWIDKIRTPRASNEARQVAFIKLSNQVQRLVGVKAAELGANAVVGYQQDFDLEGEAGVVARAIGTAVSITPLPSLYQSINIPACTQQQLRKYLDILALDSDSITDLNEYFQNHQDELHKLLNILHPRHSSLMDDPDNIDDDEKSENLTRQSSIKSYRGNISLYHDDYVSHKSLKDISDDQTDLNKLLKQSEDSDSDSSGPLKKIKKMKTSFFSKRFSSSRSRKSEKQDDNVSIKSNSSDTSRLSLTELKNEFKKLKRLKKPKFRKAFVNKEEEGIGMASILARSVIHAHTSLACIAETQDSEHSPSSTVRRTSESEPTINKSDEDKAKREVSVNSKTEGIDTKKTIPEIHTSLKDITTEIDSEGFVARKLSESCPATPITNRNENLLKLPEQQGYFGSLTLSCDSSEVYSSSEEEEDDESSDQKTDTEKTVETTSSVVDSVLNNTVDPALIAHMERKLSVLEGILPTLPLSRRQSFNDRDPKAITSANQSDLSDMIKPSSSSVNQHTNDNKELKETIKEKSTDVFKETKTVDTEISTTTTSNTGSQTCLPIKSHNLPHFKFHNPFSHKKVSQSLSAPCSPVEKTNFIYRSSKRIKRQFSKFSNSKAMRSISHYSLMPKKKDTETKISLSHPGSASNMSSRVPSETVLGTPFLSYADLFSLDKENTDKNAPLYKSDEIPRSRVKMYIGSEPVSRASISGISSPSHKESMDSSHKSHKREKLSLKPTGLVHTAMETILMDTVQNLLVPTSPEPSTQTKEQKFFADVNEKLEKVEKEATRRVRHYSESEKSVSSKSTESYASKDNSKRRHSFKFPKKKSSTEGLVHTAIETILIDKVQSLLIPTTPEVEQNTFFKDSAENSSKIILREDVPLLQNAIKSAIVKENQSQSIKEPEMISLSESSLKETKSSSKCTKNTSLFHSAMETMLIDRVQSLLPESSNLNIELDKQSQDHFNRNENMGSSSLKQRKSSSTSEKSNSLFHSAMETMLIDRVHSILPDSSTLSIEESSKKEHFEKTLNTSKDDINNETALDKHSQDDVNENENTSSSSSKERKSSTASEKNTSLFHSAMETILIDKVRSLLPVTSLGNNSEKDNPEETSIDSIKDDKAALDPSKSVKILANKQNDDVNQSLNTVISSEKREKKLTRQNSIDSVTDPDQATFKMSKETDSNTIIPCNMSPTKPVLQHFHPILSGAPLETIPSLPESSFDQNESLDVEGTERACECQPECSSDTNSASVCGNSHAACHFDRVEKEREAEEEAETDFEKCDREKGSPRHARHESYGGREPVPMMQQSQTASLHSSSTPLGIHRRSSDSDLSITPKGGSLTASVNAGSGGGAILRPSMNSNNLDMLEYPFLTMTEYPSGFILHLGGTVCSRSVKLVDGGGESATRAAWWAELRTELRAHARALRCNAVIAYSETTAICEDVCVLSACGTAAVINLDCDFTSDLDQALGAATSEPKLYSDEPEVETCTVAHVPYSPGTGPYRAELSNCGTCRKARVPAVILATCSKPNRLQSCSKAVTLTAVAARVRRAQPTSEPGARDISDQLPFLEYELHKMLLAKLRMQGANALFSLRTQVAIGERVVMALATGAAYRIITLPAPTPPTIKASENDKEAIEIQKALWETFNTNKIYNGFDIVLPEPAAPPSTSSVMESETDELPALDLCADKDACVLELDEAEDVETARALTVRRLHMQMQVYNNDVKPAPNVPPQAFAQVWRGRLAVSSPGPGTSAAAEKHVSRALDGVAYKLRRMQPFAIVSPRFQLELPEDEIQLVVSGSAIQLIDPNAVEPNGVEEYSAQAHPNGYKRSVSPAPGGNEADDDIFVLDEEQQADKQNHNEHHHNQNQNQYLSNTPNQYHSQSLSQGHNYPNQNDSLEDRNMSGQPPPMVSLTSLSHVCGSRVIRRICALRLLFVRETTAVRELGGLSGFLHTFTCEVLAIVRAYTAALGGNTLTSFYITQLMLQDNAHKNQGQCLLSVGGDVVHITY